MLTRWNDFAWTRWNELPRQDLGHTLATLAALSRQMDHWLEGDAHARPGVQSGPRIDIRDLGTQVLVRAELPGCQEKNINISLDRGRLTIGGERPLTPPEGYAVHHQERGAWRFSRTFSLPCRVDGEKASAVLKDGVLLLTLPKVPEEQPRQITVKGS